MAYSALVQVRIDEETKRKADTLFADLGFDTPTAIRIFLNQCIRREGMPFEVAKPTPNPTSNPTSNPTPNEKKPTAAVTGPSCIVS